MLQVCSYDNYTYRKFQNHESMDTKTAVDAVKEYKHYSGEHETNRSSLSISFEEISGMVSNDIMNVVRSITLADFLKTGRRKGTGLTSSSQGNLITIM